jgi:A118 family predicted phage portal protein
MFQRFLDWIRGVLHKMLSTSTVKEAFNVDVAVSAPMAEALQLWSQLYANQAPWLTTDIHSLNLPAAIAGEIARAATLELKITITGSARADYLAAQLSRLLPKLRQMVEYGAAKGGLIFKPYIDGRDIPIDCVQADQFYPIAFDANGNITASIFADQRTAGDKYYTRLEYHQMTPAGYMIRNIAYRSSNRDTLGQPTSLAAIDAWASLAPEATITGITRPLYAYFRYPMANNIDPTSPLGVSCYARAIDLIKDADKQWSNLLWEFESGQRALYVDINALATNGDGKQMLLPNRRLYRTLNASGNIGDEDMYHEWTPSLREANILNGLDAILRRIEFECGLAYGTLSNPQAVDKTATELKISQQRSYATISDTQKALQAALEELLYAMDVWATLGKLAPAGSYKATYDFDDSIIVDKEAQMQADLQTVNMDAMPKYIFLMRNYGLDEATAKAWIAAKDEELNLSYANTPAQ